MTKEEVKYLSDLVSFVFAIKKLEKQYKISSKKTMRLLKKLYQDQQQR